jgi:hypothetical protein
MAIQDVCSCESDGRDSGRSGKVLCVLPTRPASLVKKCVGLVASSDKLRRGSIWGVILSSAISSRSAMNWGELGAEPRMSRGLVKKNCVFWSREHTPISMEEFP